jgi:hypothetical protein
VRKRVHLVALVASVLCLGNVGLADAEPAPYAPYEGESTLPEPLPNVPCPEPPEPAAEGSEAVTLETRNARIEAAETCRAQVAATMLVAERVWWVVTEQLRQHEQGVSELERLAAYEPLLSQLEPINNRLADKIDTEVVDWSAGTLPVHDAAAVAAEGENTTEGTDATESIAASVDAGAEATRSALWYLIGVAAGGFAAYCFYRQVMPRA